MSGNMNLQLVQNEGRERQYLEMVRRVSRNAALSSNESSFGLHVNNISQQPRNITFNNTTQQNLNPERSVQQQPLSTLQFYNRSTSATSNQLPNNSFSVMSGFAPSESSVFRAPSTTSQFNEYAKFKQEIELLLPNIREINKANLKMVLRIFKAALHASRFPPQGGSSEDPLAQIQHICSIVTNQYYSGGRIPQSVSSAASDNTSGFVSFNNPSISMQQSERSVPQPATSYESQIMFNNPSTSMQHSERSVPQPATSYDSQIMYKGNSSSTSYMTGISSSQSMQPKVSLPRISRVSVVQTEAKQSSNSKQQPAQPPKSKGRPKKKQTSALDDSLSLFSESMRENERPVQQPPTNVSQKTKTGSSRATVKATPRPKKEPNKVPVKNTSNIKCPERENATLKEKQLNEITNETSSLPIGQKGVTRSGRAIKSPVSFWKGNKSKANNSTPDVSKVTPDESKNISNLPMTLRSNRRLTPCIDHGKTSANSTPLTTIYENCYVPRNFKKPPAKTQSKIDDKENSVVKPIKPTSRKKKGTEAKSVKAGKAKQTEDVKIVRKRKSAGLEENLSKKKKVEDVPESQKRDACTDVDAYESDDDLFGGLTYKKTVQSAYPALSPTSGMLSAKKSAAESSLGKETPPCKYMADMLDTTRHSAASSAAREVPETKMTHVVKRVKKVLEKGKQKNTKKTTKKVPQKEDSKISKLLQEAVCTSSNATYKVFMTRELMYSNRDDDEDSDDDDDAEDDDDLQ